MEAIKNAFFGAGQRLGTASGGDSTNSDVFNRIYKKCTIEVEDQEVELYRLKMESKNEADGKPKYHTIAKIPRDMTTVEHFSEDRKMGYFDREAKFAKRAENSLQSVYNIVFVDTSSSMGYYWHEMVMCWNSHVAPKLDGVTEIYTFGAQIRFMHKKSTINLGAFAGGHTNLSKALEKLYSIIMGCPNKHIRAFLLTDGAHSEYLTDEKRPTDIIWKMRSPYGKRVDMFVYGMSNDFPVEVSLQLRKTLHTGSISVPIVFWAKERNDISEQIKVMAANVFPPMNIHVNEEALLMPGLNYKKDIVYPGEYLYFKEDPETILKTLKLYCEDEAYMKVEYDFRRHSNYYSMDHYYDYHMMLGPRLHRRGMRGDMEDELEMMRELDEEMFEEVCRHRGIDPEQVKRKKRKDDRPDAKRAKLNIKEEINTIDVRFLLDNLLQNWLSVLYHRQSSIRKEDRAAIYEHLESIFKANLETEFQNVDEVSTSMNARLQRKKKASLLQEFAEMIKGSRDTIETKNKFGNQVEMVKAVLKTTVISKYHNRAMQIKGVQHKDFIEDSGEFMKEYRKIETRLKQLGPPSIDDCCRIYMQSFVGDLQDDLLPDLLKISSQNFLKELTITGIPVFAPLKDSTQINPWTLQINNICISPYDILCQRILEDNFDKHADNKEVKLKYSDVKSHFNIVIPIIPRLYAQLLKDLVNTRLYARACTFCILKSSLIVDKNCHLAALGCVWMRSIKDFPANKRPEYIRNRILNVEATAKLYIDRPSTSKYIECLLDQPETALTTEAEAKYKDFTIKCESLIKPCFLLFLSKDNIPLLTAHQANFAKIIQLVLMEFIGRCVSSYKSDTPHVDFFMPSVDSEKRDVWLTEKSNEIYKRLEVSGTILLKRYPDMGGLKKYIKDSVLTEMKHLDEDLAWKKMLDEEERLTIEENNAKIKKKIEEIERWEWRNLAYDYEDEDYRLGYDTSEDADPEVLQERAEREAAIEARLKEQADKIKAEHYVFKLKAICPNYDKMNKLRHSGSAGHIRWEDLKAWAGEMLSTLGPESLNTSPFSGGAPGGPSAGGGAGPSQADDGPEGMTRMEVDQEGPAPEQRPRPLCLIQEDIDYAFSIDMVTVYLMHSLKYRSSRLRLMYPMMSPEEAEKILEESIEKEWKRIITNELKPRVEKMVLDAWMNCYKEAHNQLIRPMTRRQIIAEATARGIEVTEETFNQVYRHNSFTGLLRNCCMIESCPHYLIPNRHHNAHLEVERQEANYPHTLHMLTARNMGDVERTTTAICNAVCSGTRKRKQTKRLDSEGDIRKYVEELKPIYKEYEENKKS